MTVIRNKLHYLVDCSIYSPNDWTWEPVENLNNIMENVADFHRPYPKKPNPSSYIVTRKTPHQRRADDPKKQNPSSCIATPGTHRQRRG